MIWNAAYHNFINTKHDEEGQKEWERETNEEQNNTSKMTLHY